MHHCGLDFSYKQKYRTMINQQTLLGNWNEIKGKLRSNWGSLTDDDLTIIDGNVDQLVGAIQRKTGEDTREHRAFFRTAHFQWRSLWSAGPVETVQPAGARQASDSVQETFPKSRRLGA